MKQFYIVCSFLLTLFVLSDIVVDNRQKEALSRWNNGQCFKCGTKYELLNASRSRGVEYYHFKCVKCGNIQTFSENIIKIASKR